MHNRVIRPPLSGGGQPGELKHLSTPRKRDYSLSSGERTGKSPNQDCLVACRPMHFWGCKAQPPSLQEGQEVTNHHARRRSLERAAKEGERPVVERVDG